MHEAALKGRQNKGTRMTINYLYKVGVLSPLTIDNKKPLRLRKRIKRREKKRLWKKCQGTLKKTGKTSTPPQHLHHPRGYTIIPSCSERTAFFFFFVNAFGVFFFLFLLFSTSVLFY